MDDAFGTFEQLLRVLGPLAGTIFAVRVAISYQRDLLTVMRDANLGLRSEIHEQDERIDLLEQKMEEQRREHHRELEASRRAHLRCEARNMQLIAAVRNAGIEVPEPVDLLSDVDPYDANGG